MLVRYPFIALSATVGEPHVFQAWLTRIGRPFALDLAKKKTKYFDSVQLIYHHLRWSDLQKYIYCPVDGMTDEEGKSLYEKDNSIFRSSKATILGSRAALISIPQLPLRCQTDLTTLPMDFRPISASHPKIPCGCTTVRLEKLIEKEKFCLKHFGM
jgi:hypothetical protein